MAGLTGDFASGLRLTFTPAATGFTTLVVTTAEVVIETRSRRIQPFVPRFVCTWTQPDFEARTLRDAA